MRHVKLSIGAHLSQHPATHWRGRATAKAAVSAFALAGGLVGCSGHGSDAVESKAALNANPHTTDFAVYAQNSATLRDRVGVTGGDVGVGLVGTGPFLGGAYELTMTADAHVDTARSVLANRILLQDRARVGDIQVNQLTQQNHPTFTHQYPFPATAMPALPPMAPVTPGTAALTVKLGGTQVANPGSYGAVSVGDRGILRLNGGVYQLASLQLGNDARIEALAPVQLRVAGRFGALDRSFIGAAAGVTLTAGDLRIEVSGKNGNSGSLTDSPKAAVFGSSANVRAVMLVPNGTLLSGQRAIVVGAYVARDVYMDLDSTITYQSGVGPSGCLQSCDDGNPCTIDACSVGVCVHSSSPAGTSCADSNACNGAEKCDGAGHCQTGTPVVCAALDQCHAVGVCNTATGLCSNPAKPNGTVCNDANLCTKTDVCTAGVCGGTAYTCNDGLACTTDSCNGDGTCTFAVMADNCLVGGVCYANAATNPANQCEQCTPATSQTAWSPKSAGTACNDDHPCTSGDACNGVGACVGTAYSCNDNLDCTVDSCNGDGTCSHTIAAGCVINGACYAADATNPANQCQACTPSTSATSWTAKSTGTACNDGNACTSHDICNAGVCAGTAYSCDDGLACTADSCNGDGTCSHTITAGNCVINGACYANGASNPADSCQTCNSATATTWSNQADGTTCNDSSACTPADGGTDDGGTDDGGTSDDGGATCPSHTCIAGACTGVCVPGKTQCHGQTVQTCDATGNWKDGTTCMNQACVAGTCQGVCAPAALQCNGQTPQTCDATGVWQDGPACANQACIAGTCQGVCAPGAQQCHGQIPQTCDGTGAWQDGAACANQACVAGTCQGVCAPGSQQCNGQIPQTCDATGNWKDGTACMNQACVAGACQGVCAPGSQQCNGQIPQTCDGTGAWQDGPACANQVCVAGTCQGVCAPGALQCNGPIAQTCNGLGDWQVSTSSIGCEYYPTVTANSQLVGPFHFAVAIENAGSLPANYVVTRGATSTASGQVAAASVAVVQLPWVDELKAPPSTLLSRSAAGNGAYHLVTDQPVTVYQYNPLEYKIGSQYSYTADASLLLPVNTWTENYTVAARNTWYFTPIFYPGFYAITASQDNTVVTLNPSITGRWVVAGAGVAANGSGTITLNTGDVLQVLSASGGGSPDSSDLTGTGVLASKPVQVIAGHDCTNIPYYVGACDHLEDSMLPIETLSGTYIVAAPWIAAGTLKNRVVRVIGVDNSATLQFDPPQAGAPSTILAGQYVELPPSQTSYRITSDHKILVAQYMEGQLAGGNAGDPSMALAVPVEQYRSSYRFFASTSYDASFVDITAPTGATVTLDGVRVGATAFATVGTSGYGVARVQLSNAGSGDHSITSDHDIDISVYGYGQNTSYWYPGGLNLIHLAE
jgi:hypothetical protein